MGGDSAERDAPAPLSARRALARATLAVSRRIDRLLESESGGPGPSSQDLDTVRAKVALVLDGADPAPIGDWFLTNPDCQPLLEALIGEIVSWPAERDTAPATLRVLKACLACRAPVPPRTDDRTVEAAVGDEDDLIGRMRGPDAYDLLVEVAHDFRSPLGSILLLAEALRDGHGGPVTERQRSQLGLIYSAAFGLSSIASDVMDFAKHEQNLIGDEPVPFSPAEVFRSVERLVKPIVEEKALELRVVVPDRWQARGHPHALSRVLLNLTTNALKFTDQGSVEMGARVVPHASLEYYVHDTGRGISPERQRTLFQPFRRRSAQPEDGYHFSGSGIGLSMARRLVTAMGSELRLDSSDETGTRFSFVVGPGVSSAG